MKQIITVLQGGERLPMVMGNDNIPLLYPNLYVVSMLRKKDAMNTIKAKCRSIMQMYQWCQENEISIEDRFKTGHILAMQEIESLCIFLNKECSFKKNTKKNKTIKINKMIQLNLKMTKDNSKYVCNATYNRRLIEVNNYCRWLVDHMMNDVDRGSVLYIRTMNSMEAMSKHINAHKLHVRGSVDDEPRGLSTKAEEILQAVIKPQSDANPYHNDFVKKRNHLYVMISMLLGLRRGEMLKLEVRQIDIANRKIHVKRNPNDKIDTRTNEPNVKTRSRILEFDDTLLILLRDYINKRKKLKRAWTHPFLFTTQSGNPLSLSAADDIYKKLRERIPQLFEEGLTQHVLRHQWNYNFTEEMKKVGLTDAQIEFYRKQHMGWSHNSKMPDLYNKRAQREAAQKASLTFQEKINEKINGGNSKI